MSASSGVFVDARSARLQRTTGWERYVRGLLSGLASAGYEVRSGGGGVESVVGRLVGDWYSVPMQARGSALRHFPSFPPTPVSAQTPCLYTLYDLTWWRYAETSSFLGAHYYRRLAEQHLRHRRPLCTISMTVRDEIVADWNYDSADVFVVPPGLDDVFTEPVGVESAREDFFLSVATLEPRKNLLSLLRAWQESGCHATHQLVLVGRARTSDLPLDVPGVVIRHDVGDAELRSLYRRASALVLPSVYEGFGLPLIEALSQSLPVICSDLPVFREVAGDGATFFDPRDVSMMAGALHAAARDRPAVPHDVRDRITTTYDWRRTALEQVRAYRALTEE